MTDDARQWLRKTSLVLLPSDGNQQPTDNSGAVPRVEVQGTDTDKGLDLSEMHFTFSTQQQDEESPNNVQIRVYNLSDDTVKKIRGEYANVMLQAGYEGDNYGVIFKGSIKQYRIGKDPDGISSYLDILAADGDVAYNFAVVNASLAAAGTNNAARFKVLCDAMGKNGTVQGTTDIPPAGGVLPRGKVLFGMARTMLRSLAQNNGAAWSIQDGKVVMTTLTGYLPGEAVEINASTGLIGRVEQTAEGIRCRVLLNPRITCGQTVKINNQLVNQTAARAGSSSDIPGAQLAYNRYAGIELLANVTTDGLYRVYVVEHTGDTRGVDYYSDLICLSIDPVTDKVVQKNGS